MYPEPESIWQSLGSIRKVHSPAASEWASMELSRAHTVYCAQKEKRLSLILAIITETISKKWLQNTLPLGFNVKLNVNVFRCFTFNASLFPLAQRASAGSILVALTVLKVLSGQRAIYNVDPCAREGSPWLERRRWRPFYCQGRPAAVVLRALSHGLHLMVFLPRFMSWSQW